MVALRRTGRGVDGEVPGDEAGRKTGRERWFLEPVRWGRATRFGCVRRPGANATLPRHRPTKRASQSPYDACVSCL